MELSCKVSLCISLLFCFELIALIFITFMGTSKCSYSLLKPIHSVIFWYFVYPDEKFDPAHWLQGAVILLLCLHVTKGIYSLHMGACPGGHMTLTLVCLEHRFWIAPTHGDGQQMFFSSPLCRRKDKASKKGKKGRE